MPCGSNKFCCELDEGAFGFYDSGSGFVLNTVQNLPAAAPATVTVTSTSVSTVTTTTTIVSHYTKSSKNLLLLDLEALGIWCTPSLRSQISLLLEDDRQVWELVA